MQGIPAVLYARWAAGSEFQNFPPELSRVGKTGSSPKKNTRTISTVRTLGCHQHAWPDGRGVGATSAYRYGGYI